MTDPEIERLREQITSADRTVLDAVNSRLELVARLKAYKESQGIEFVDEEREERLLRELVEANRGPLSEDGVRELFREVLDLTKREVR